MEKPHRYRATQTHGSHRGFAPAHNMVGSALARKGLGDERDSAASDKSLGR